MMIVLEQMRWNIIASFGDNLLEFVAIPCYNQKKGGDDMIVMFCGHRNLFGRREILAELETTLRNLISAGADTFLHGGYGDFDSLAAWSVHRLKKEFPQIRSILVLPYPDRKYDTDLYDESIYPPLEKVPRRFAISHRNEWMVNHSDVVVSYVRYGWGGAAATLEYARRKKKRILSLAEE